MVWKIISIIAIYCRSGTFDTYFNLVAWQIFLNHQIEVTAIKRTEDVVEVSWGTLGQSAKLKYSSIFDGFQIAELNGIIVITALP